MSKLLHCVSDIAKNIPLVRITNERKHTPLKNEAITAAVWEGGFVRIMTEEEKRDVEIQKLLSGLRQIVRVTQTVTSLHTGNYRLNLTILPVVPERKQLVLDVLDKSTLIFKFSSQNHEKKLA